MNLKWSYTLGLLLLTSCASPPIILAPVGPGSGAPAASIRGKGDLQVFTETEEYLEDDLLYHPHTDYQLCTAAGERLKRIWNHQNHEDENPATVSLTPGEYLVKARAEFYGSVTVPVVIKPNRTTIVILQPGWKPHTGAATSELVQLPNGYSVGWRAEIGKEK